MPAAVAAAAVSVVGSLDAAARERPCGIACQISFRSPGAPAQNDGPHPDGIPLMTAAGEIAAIDADGIDAAKPLDAAQRRTLFEDNAVKVFELGGRA